MKLRAVPKRTLQIILVLAVLLIGLRLALPVIVKDYLNKTLNSIPGYYGHVDDVHISLWRGAYRIRGISFVKTHGDEKEPLFSAESIEFSVDWRALLQRRIVSKIRLEHPELQFIQRATAESSQTKVDESWQDKVKKLTVFDINKITLHNGLIRYKDETKAPKINFYFSRLNLLVENISNAEKVEEGKLPSKFEADSLVLNSGRFKASGRADFFAEPLTAHLKATIRGLELKELNAFAKAYGNFDFEKGNFAVTTELNAGSKAYDGYVKTLAKGVSVIDFSKEKKQGDSTLHLIWEGLVGGIVAIFSNQRHDQFAARIPISGSRKSVEIGSWSTIGSILRNAFVQALSPQFEDKDAGKDDGKDADDGGKKAESK